MNYDYAADQLFAVAKILKGFNSVELHMCSATLVNIGAEVRKLAPAVKTLGTAPKGKPEPTRIDPNSMIPRPVAPPNGSGPVKLVAPEYDPCQLRGRQGLNGHA